MATQAPPPAPATSPAPSEQPKQPKEIPTTPASVTGKIASLSPADFAIVCHAIGATANGETQALLHPTSVIYPPKGLTDGLYKNVIRSRTISQYQYYTCSIFFNISLILQLLLGAALTALGSSSHQNGKNTAITILAAANTVNAGLLALMHNSGLPDRYKKDCDEFDSVYMFMKELMDTGIVKQGLTREDIIADCYTRYAVARETVSRNKPASYSATGSSAGASTDHVST